MSKFKRFLSLFGLLLVVTMAYFMGGMTFNTTDKVEAIDRKVQKFDIDQNVASRGCANKNCSGGHLSFVTAVGHDTYTSYIFICDSCFHHTEISPKGISLAPWK